MIQRQFIRSRMWCESQIVFEYLYCMCVWFPRFSNSETQSILQISGQWSINESISLPSNSKTERKTSLSKARPQYLAASVSEWMWLHPQIIYLIGFPLTLYIQLLSAWWNPVITHNCAGWLFLCANITSKPFNYSNRIKHETACNNLLLQQPLWYNILLNTALNTLVFASLFTQVHSCGCVQIESIKMCIPVPFLSEL